MKKHIENLTKELFPTGMASAVITQMYDLPPVTNKVKRQRNIKIVTPEDITLLTDIYSPKEPGPHPALLMRTPYGRFGFGMVAEAYAARGFITVLQACRGTDGSSGVFDPLINERRDGLATLDWIKQQNWYDGRIGPHRPLLFRALPNGPFAMRCLRALPYAPRSPHQILRAWFSPAGPFHFNYG